MLKLHLKKWVVSTSALTFQRLGTVNLGFSPATEWGKKLLITQRPHMEVGSLHLLVTDTVTVWYSLRSSLGTSGKPGMVKAKECHCTLQSTCQGRGLALRLPCIAFPWQRQAQNDPWPALNMGWQQPGRSPMYPNSQPSESSKSKCRSGCFLRGLQYSSFSILSNLDLLF